MPKITLTDSPNDLGWVWSVMLFPNDEALRNQNYAVEFTKLELEKWDELDEKRVSPKTKDSANLIETNIEVLRLLIEAPADSAFKTLRTERIKQGIVAGNILGSLYVMDRFGLAEPSMNKAVDYAKKYAGKAKYGDGSSMEVSEAKIREYWVEFKPVAHLWAAFQLNSVYSFSAESNVFSETDFLTFLQVAAGIYDFGSKFIPKRAKVKKAFLDVEKCWILDSNVDPLHLESEIKPEYLIKFLKKYKAPKKVV